jgi:hypothetical protein
MPTPQTTVKKYKNNIGLELYNKNILVDKVE